MGATSKLSVLNTYVENLNEASDLFPNLKFKAVFKQAITKLSIQIKEALGKEVRRAKLVTGIAHKALESQTNNRGVLNFQR